MCGPIRIWLKKRVVRLSSSQPIDGRSPVVCGGFVFQMNSSVDGVDGDSNTAASAASRTVDGAPPVFVGGVPQVSFQQQQIAAFQPGGTSTALQRKSSLGWSPGVLEKLKKLSKN